MNAPKKELSVLMLSPPSNVKGGVTTFAETVISNLQNCKVTKLANGSNEEGKESKFSSFLRILSTPIKLVREMRAHRYEIIHINPSLSYKSVVRDCLLLFAARLAGFRNVLFYIHGWDQPLADKIAGTLGVRQFFVWLMNGTARIMVLSPDFREFLVMIGVKPEKVITTRTMFDGSILAKTDEPAEPSARARRNILFMSRFIKDKGVYELVRAYARIAVEFGDVDLIMAGDGEECASLKEEVMREGLQSRVTFTGYVKGAEKARLLKECYIYTLPTYMKGEGMPIALLEAMAAGKPIICGNEGGIKYIISDPENGIIIKGITVDSVEAALRKMLNDPDYCRECGKHNESYAWGTFEARQVVINEIQSQYKAIAQENA